MVDYAKSNFEMLFGHFMATTTVQDAKEEFMGIPRVAAFANARRDSDPFWHTLREYVASCDTDADYDPLQRVNIILCRLLAQRWEKCLEER